MQSPDIRYENARAFFAKIKGNPLGKERLERWVLPSDRHLPSSLIVLPLSEVLCKPYSTLLRTKGVGESKLEKLVVLIERALKELAIEGGADLAGDRDMQVTEDRPVEPTRRSDISESAFPNGFEMTLSSLTPQCWELICRCIKDHCLEHYPLGRFAEKLDDLPRGLWSCPLSDFVNHSHRELKQLKGYGELRITSVLRVLAGTAKLLAECPADTHLGIKVFPLRIDRMTAWISSVLHDDRLPDYTSLCQHFVLPLLRQLEVDLGSQPAEMIERRLGIETEPETLQDIAESFQLTRERIRQLTARAPEVMELRWPEGKHLLDDFFEKFRSSGDAVRHVALIQRTLGLLFNVETQCGVSSEDVLQAWDRAGRLKETPMSEDEILVWLGGSFPDLVPSLGASWITSESSSVEHEGRRIFFSNDQSDQFLYQLYQSGRATAVNEMVDLDERETRNVRMKLQRDLRFTEDEEHCFLPTEFCGFTRDSFSWHAQLEPATPNSRPTRTFVSIDNIIALALGGFLRLGIVDATVWGFHRFVNEQLRLLYDARLPISANAFVLGDMVVRQSGRRIRPMRRRRLRWEKDGSMIARGKRGWVGFVVQQAGVPIVLDELSGMLNQFYQDYDSYVVEQLNLDAEEEGESDFGVTMLPGIPHKLSPILVPNQWELDAESDNTSDGVKLSVARAVILLQENRLALSDLEHIPWFVELIQRHCYGTDFQGSPQVPRRSKKPEIQGTFFSLNATELEKHDAVPANGRSAPQTPQKVDDLLQRFL